MEKFYIYNDDYYSLNTAHWFLFHDKCECEDCAYQHQYTVFFEYIYKTRENPEITGYVIEDSSGKDITIRISVSDDKKLINYLEDWVVTNRTPADEDEHYPKKRYDIDGKYYL